MRTLILMIAACAALAFIVTSAAAELTPEQAKQAEALIAQFTAPEFAVRQQAVEKLVAIGPDIVPLIRKALAGTNDNEVRLRCELVLKGLAATYGVIIDPTKPDAPLVLDINPSKITLNVREMPVRDVVDMLSGQSRNKPFILSNAVKDKPVTLAVKDASYWEAVDRLCDAAGLMVSADPAGTAGLMLQERENVADVGGYAGPVAVKVDSGSLSRRFRLPRSQFPRVPASLSYSITLFWEDRLPVSSVAIQFTKAALPGGKDLFAGSTNRYAQTITAGGARARCWGSAWLSVPGLPEGASRFSAIEGSVKVAYRIGERTLKLDDVFAGKPRTVSAEGVTLTSREGLQRKKSSVVVTLETKREGGDPNISFATESGHASFFLVDPKGARCPGMHQGGRFGAKKTGRKNRQGIDELAEDAEFNLRFDGLADLDGAWSILLTYPERIETREYPFTIKDVPLP